MNPSALLFWSLFVFVQGENAEELINNKCVSSCPEGWNKVDHHCLFWPKISQIWLDAEQYCNNEGGDLASVTSENIQDYIGSEIQKQNPFQVWIGGIDKEGNGTWRWTDGSVWDFTQWETQEPHNKKKDHCLKITKEGKWRNRNCNSNQRFIFSQLICSDPDTKVTRTENDKTINNDNNNKNSTNDMNNSNSDNNSNRRDKNKHTILAIAVGLPVGLIFVFLIGCLACKRSRRKEEKMNADENPVYGIYQLDEAYERQYSTNEVVDNNVYYAQ